MVVDTPELRNDVREFLTSRRAKITPQQAGLPAGRNRRVPGLRRTEVASLAGMSVEYYSRLERGNLAGVSEEVLEALSRALELDEAERSHLHDLARAAASRPFPRKRAQPESVRQSLQATLDAITTAPAVINNGRGDMVAANALARALFSEMFVSSPRRPVNNARFVFLEPGARPSTGTGRRPPTTPSPYCARKPDKIPTTEPCPISSESSPPNLKSSGPVGPPTTSDSTSRAPSVFGTQPWGTSSSPTKSSTSRLIAT